MIFSFGVIWSYTCHSYLFCELKILFFSVCKVLHAMINIIYVFFDALCFLWDRTWTYRNTTNVSAA